MATVFLISGALALSLALVWIFTRPLMAPVAAYFGTWALTKSGYAPLNANTLMFWAVVIILLVAIQMVRGYNIVSPRSLRLHVAVGALAFALVGIPLGHGAIIAGAITGVIIGAVAYMRIKKASWQTIRRPVIALGALDTATGSLVALSIYALTLYAQSL